MPAPRSPSQVGRARYLGRQSFVSVALLPVGVRQEPVEQTLVVQSNRPFLATTIPITSGLLSPIQAGQHLLARDSDSQEYPIRVSATANSGASTLTVTALRLPIPAGAQIQFPPELLERTGADVTQSLNLSEAKTFNVGGSRDGVITGTTDDISLPGVFFEFCPVFRTFAEHAKNGREFWFHVELTPPRDGWRGRIRKGAGTITQRDTKAPVDGFVTADYSAAFLGNPIEIDADLVQF